MPRSRQRDKHARRLALSTFSLVAWSLELGACGLDYIGEWPSARAVD